MCWLLSLVPLSYSANNYLPYCVPKYTKPKQIHLLGSTVDSHWQKIRRHRKAGLFLPSPSFLLATLSLYHHGTGQAPSSPQFSPCSKNSAFSVISGFPVTPDKTSLESSLNSLHLYSPLNHRNWITFLAKTSIDLTVCQALNSDF
jgi:hypothetical protein